jgi:YD repeat-containing protein
MAKVVKMSSILQWTSPCLQKSKGGPFILSRVIFWFVLCLTSPLLAQTSMPVQYFYDDIGRLIRVVDGSGNVASYAYDAVGNLLSISRSSVPANNGLAILSFSPQSGTVGQIVTIQGQGFNTTPASNSVQFNGVATAVTAATANTLTVTVPTGATTGPISVTVGGSSATSDKNFTIASATLTNISVIPGSVSVPNGTVQQFSAVGGFTNGTPQDVTTSVTWSSSNPAVVTISNAPGSQGQATAVATGSARITATSGAVSSSVVFNVKAVSSVAMTPQNAYVLTNATQHFTATAQFNDGSSADVTAAAVWSSGTPAVATISNSAGSQGLVTTLSNGSSVIVATYAGVQASTYLFVHTPTSVSIAPSSPSMAKGTIQNFTATSTFTDGGTQDVTKSVVWSSSNLTVARVSDAPGTQGIGTAVATGTATISITYGTLSASTTLTVTGPTPTSIAVSPPSPLLPPGNTQQLKATETFTDGTSSDVTSSATWSSSDTSIATVGGQGLTTAVADGSATITASLGALSGFASLTVTSSQIYQGNLYAADGQTPATGQYVRIYDVATNSLLASVFSDGTGSYQVAGTPPGSQGASVQVFMGCSATTVSAVGNVATAGQPIVVNLTLPVLSLSGRVSFYDGTPAPHADVFLTSDQSCYGDATYDQIVRSADVNGNYAVLVELKVGAFTIFAQDYNTGLLGSAPGNVTSATSPVTVDVSLPPTGTVTGAVFDSSGNPLPGGTVQLYSSISEYIKTDIMPSGNTYQFSQVPVGPVVVAASPVVSQFTTDPILVLGASSGTLASAGQAISVNVTLQPTSSVGGTVFATDGVTPVAANVTVENPNVAGGIADFYQSVATSPSGAFSVPNVPIGSIRVAAVAGLGIGNGAVVTGTLSQNSNLQLNPVLGNALSPGFNGTYNLTDVNGFVFDLDCAGEPLAGGNPTAGVTYQSYNEAAFPSTNYGQYLPYWCIGGDAAILSQAGREVQYGPRPMPGVSENGGDGVIQAARRVFVPQTGGFARYLEVLTNPLSTPVTVTFEIDNYLRAFYDTLAVDPASNGNTFSVLTGSGQPAAETLAFVIGGGGSVQTNTGLSLNEDAFPYSWTVTIPPNQTVILMHFLIQRAPGDVSGATAQAEALVNLTDPNAMVGMSAQDKAEVVNFNVP